MKEIGVDVAFDSNITIHKCSTATGSSEDFRRRERVDLLWVPWMIDATTITGADGQHPSELRSGYSMDMHSSVA